MLHLTGSLTAIVGCFFLAIGIFNLVVGARRMLASRIEWRDWYKQLGMLTGIEYILLAGVLFINLGMTNDVFPHSLATIVSACYTLVLILAAVVLGLMLYQSLIKPRLARRRLNASMVATEPVVEAEEEREEKRLTAEQIQRRRERRKHAALSRRRQSGRA